MIQRLKGLIAFILLLSVSQSLWCQTLYVTLSDSHSNYDNLVKFLQVLEVKVENFKIQHPQGQVVLLINGDYSGASGLASVLVDGKMDAGAIGLNALKLLAQNDVHIVFNSGNHEAHDFAPMDGNNQLYVEQMKDLKSAGDKVVLLGTNQNFIPGTALDRIFVKHFDYLDKQSGTNRILGLTLKNLEIKSGISLSDKLFSSISDYESSLNGEIEKAIRDQVSQITIMIHDETPVVAALADKIEQRYGNRIQFNTWIAGHDHKEARQLSKRGTPILNAGSQFGFMDWIQLTTVHANDVNAFSMDKYSNFEKMNTTHSTKLASSIKNVRERINAEVVGIKNKLMGVSHGRFNIVDGKLAMKKAIERTEIGLSLANSMRAWSLSEVKTDLPTIGIFNTSSYRVDRGFGDVELTDLHIVEMYPFLTEGKIHKLQTSDLLEVVQKTVMFQENINAVQLSSNLRLITEMRTITSHVSGLEKTIEYPVGIEIFEHQWRTLNSKEFLMAGIDDWTTINGYKHKYESKYLRENFGSNLKDFAPVKKVKTMLEILQVFIGAELRKAEKLNRTDLKSVPVEFLSTKVSKPSSSLSEKQPSVSKAVRCEILFAR